jgi:hypothetical protein
MLIQKPHIKIVPLNLKVSERHFKMSLFRDGNSEAISLMHISLNAYGILKMPPLQYYSSESKTYLLTELVITKFSEILFEIQF